MEVFKNVVIKCAKDDNFDHHRNINYSCGGEFIIDDSDVYSVVSTDYFGEKVIDYYAICPMCGYINKLDESILPEEVKRMAILKNSNELFLYQKNNARSELIYLDYLSGLKRNNVLKKIR